MPNVVPKGLFARHGGGWKPPAAIYARVAQEWKPAVYVWARKDGAWQVIWGAAVSPPVSVSLAWVQPHKVKVDWVLPAPNTSTQWIVRRTDGTEVGRVAADATTITDEYPVLQPFTEAPTSTALAYTVAGTDGTNETTRVLSSVLNVTLDPASVTTSVAYPSAASDSTANVTVNWTPNATFGDPDYWQVWSGGWLGAKVPGTARSVTVTGVARGGAWNFRAVPFVTLQDGSVIQAGNSPPAANTNVTPNVPRPQSWGPDGISRLCLSFWGPAAGEMSSFDLEWHDNAWHTWGNTTSGGPHCISTTVPLWARVRTVAPGGVSDWAQVGPAYPVNDATGPGPSSISFWGPQSSYGRMVVQGTWSPDADTARGEIYFARIGVTNWTLAWSGPVTPGGQCGPIAIGNGNAGEQCGVLIRTFDATGNQGQDAVAYYTLQPSPAIIDPTDGGTGRNGAWRNDAVCSGIEQCFGQTSSGANQGTFFYGGNLTAFCQARAPGSLQAIDMTYARQTGQGMSAARCPVWYVHNEPNKGGAPPGIGGNGDQGCCLGTGQACTWRLPAHFMDWFRQGWQGLANWNPTGDTNTNYGKLYATGQNALGVVTGRLVIYHLG